MMFNLSADELLALQRAAFLIGPASAAALLLLIYKPTPREATAAMVAFLWQLPALLALHFLATYFGWWQFAAPRNALLGLPIDLWIGWAIWWGPVVVFLQRWISPIIIVIASIAIDFLTMPILQPLVTLGADWWIGEIAAILICLIPALWFSTLTREDRDPKRRAMFHVLGWGGYMALVLPVCALTFEGRALSALYHLPNGFFDWIVFAAGALLLFVGISATAEFARSGHGTPIPFDPPKRVVSSGPYAFTANPMQIISAAFMFALAIYARSWNLTFIAAMFAIFDAAYATWYNTANIAKAMPDEWGRYRSNVDEWRVRWRPHIHGKAEVTISGLGPAKAMWDWLWPRLSKRLQGDIELTVAPLTSHKRLTYKRAEDNIEETGVAAAGRLLEHGPAPLAILGLLLRFPFLGGALDRISALSIFVWRKYAGIL